ncbi:hypothetical protein DRQ50_01145 [bacterium]|nr:MAG: hypothetical protein DRQ50_01145 [bacterium]
MQAQGPSRRAMGILLLTATLSCCGARAFAGGTPAGADVTAQASVSWNQQGVAHSATSNATSFTVDEIVDFAVVCQDAAGVEAFPGETGRALSFTLLNTGNGPETFRLLALDALAGDDFDPLLAGVHLDTNGNGIWDPGADDVYVQGGNDPDLPADAVISIFLLVDLPPDVVDRQEGTAKLVITAMTGVGAPGTVVLGAGAGGTDAVLGSGGGTGDATALVRVAAVELELAKTAVVLDPDGGSEPRPGALITYTITVTATGGGTARGVVVTDPLPPATDFVPASLILDGVPLTDAADTDAGDYNVTIPGTLTINLGDITAISPSREIAFQVSIP